MMMMTGLSRFFFIAFLGFLCVAPAFSQLDGSGIAPDFTLTDINGNEHNLYAYLDDNKVVVIDFFAVWCSICMADAEYLEHVYDQYGPEGSDQIMMLALEADDDSSDEQTREFANQYGAGNPHINETGSVPQAYNLNFFPLYYVIAPDRSYSVIGGRQETMQALMEEAIESAPLLRTVENDLRVMAYDAPVGSLCSDSFQPSIRIQNYGRNTVDSFVVDILVDGEVAWKSSHYTDIQPYCFEDFLLPAIEQVPKGWHEIRFQFSEVNGWPDGEAGNGVVGGDFLILPDGESLELILTTDAYPKETSWKLLDQQGQLAESGAYRKGLTADTTAVCVENNACYRLILYDSYGDGMSSGGMDVNFRGDQIAAITAASFAGDSAWVDFCVYPLSVTNSLEQAGNDLRMYPNPSSGQLIIDFPDLDHEPLQWTILDLSGKAIRSGSVTGSQETATVDLSQLEAGMYFVRMDAMGKVFTKKLIIKK